MLNIAIDGHVGSGKSTLASELAKILNLKMLNTGEIYRSIACCFKEMNMEINEENIKKFVTNLNIEISFDSGEQVVYVNNKCFKGKLRSEEISMLTSKISPFLVVREKVLKLQRDFAKKNDCVMEGRDIGTVVLPNADFKFFVTASEFVRAQRRYDQLKDKTNAPSFEEILEDLRQRDYNDEHRKVAPLKPAFDSIILDTSDMTLAQTVEYCCDIIKNKK